MNTDKLTQADILDIARRLPERYEKASAFRFAGDRDQSLCASVILLKMFPELHETDLYYNEYGKPFIKANQYFSLSHTDKLSAGVCGPDAIGLDVEIPRLPTARLIDYVFSDDEKKLSDLSEKKTFTTLWTVKEAVLKASGEGLSGGLRSVDTAKVFSNGTAIYHDKFFFVRTVYLSDHVITIASEKPQDDTEIIFIG